jgi:hypothetical protein
VVAHIGLPCKSENDNLFRVILSAQGKLHIIHMNRKFLIYRTSKLTHSHKGRKPRCSGAQPAQAGCVTEFADAALAARRMAVGCSALFGFLVWCSMYCRIVVKSGNQNFSLYRTIVDESYAQLPQTISPFNFF